MKRYHGLSDEEIQENSELWEEEAAEPDMPSTTGQDLRSVGINPADIEGDLDTAGSVEADLEGGDLDADLGAEPVGATPTAEAPPQA